MKHEYYTCDVCNNKCNESEFALPRFAKEIVRGDKSNAVISQYEHLTKLCTNLCPVCQAHMANYFIELKRQPWKEND